MTSPTTTRWLSPWAALTGLGLIMVLSRSEWHSDLEWAINWAHGSTILLAPATSGIVALAIVRGYSKSFQSLTLSLARGTLTPFVIGLHIWIVAIVAWLTCILVAGIVALLSGAPPARPDTAISLVTGPAILAAASALGMTLSLTLRSIASAPLSAAIVYSLALATARIPMPRILWDGGATAPIDTLSPNTISLVGTFSINIAISAMLLSICVIVIRRRITPYSIASMVICALLVSTCIHIGYGSDYYDQDSPEIGCSRTQPVVCTFESDKLDNTYASRELGRAITRLSDAGFDKLPDRISVQPGNSRNAVRLVTSGQTRQLSKQEIVLTLVQLPLSCVIQQSDATSNAISQLRAWMVRKLSSTAVINSDAPTTRWAQDTYAALRSCNVAGILPRDGAS